MPRFPGQGLNNYRIFRTDRQPFIMKYHSQFNYNDSESPHKDGKEAEEARDCTTNRNPVLRVLFLLNDVRVRTDGSRTLPGRAEWGWRRDQKISSTRISIPIRTGDNE